MESQYHQLMMMMMKVVAMIFHLQLLSSLLVPVDEAKPHGGGVGVEKLKLKKNIYFTCSLSSFIIKDLVFVVQPNSHYYEFLSPELSNHLAELCTVTILRCSLLLRI